APKTQYCQIAEAREGIFGNKFPPIKSNGK
ncbi:unnamed protein product, partial [Allacma fusca]